MSSQVLLQVAVLESSDQQNKNSVFAQIAFIVAHQHYWEEKEKLQMFFLSGHLKQEIQFWWCVRKEEMSGETLYKHELCMFMICLLQMQYIM